MPRRLTAEGRQVREQIRLLAAHLREERRTARAEEKAAEAARPKPPPRQSRLLSNLKGTLTKLREAQAACSSATNSWDIMQAEQARENHLRALVWLYRGHAEVLTPYLDSISLTGWLSEYIRPDRRAPCPLPDFA